jgi:LacI family transcriptional regulator
VAKVISGCRSNICVSVATAERIREIAMRLHYRPNLNAKALAGTSIKMIGVLVDTCSAMISVRLVGHIESAAAANDYRVIVGEAHDSPQNLFECYEHMQQSSVDGVIILSHEYPQKRDEIHAYFRNCRNTVIIGDNYVPELPCVKVERSNAVRGAFAALQEGGRKRLGMYHLDNGELYFGFQCMKRTLRECDPNFQYYSVAPCHNEDELQKMTSDVIDNFILREKLDGLFCPNDYYAAALLQQLAERGIRVPQDIAVIGWDNDLFAPFMQPSLSTVDERVAEVGKQAFFLLKNLMENRESPAEAAQIKIPAQFIRRKSI